MRLKPEQQHVADWLAARTEAFVFLPVGFGKTAITLSAFAEMRRVYDKNWRALVVSTCAIVEHTWGQEIEKWEFDLTYDHAVGRRLAAVQARPDVLGLNFENLCWFLDLVDADPSLLPEVLVIDESSKMKDHSAQRVRRLAGMRTRRDPPGWERGYVHRFQRRVALSATPAPEGYQGLWSQEACISPRRRLGLNISHFRRQYCDAVQVNGYGQTYRVTTEGEARIEARIDPITYTIRAGNFLDLPEPADVPVEVPWTEEALEQYEELEAEAALLLEEHRDDDLEVLAPNAAVLVNKLRQVCSGFIYDDAGVARWLADPDAKIAALENLFDRTGDSTLVVFTQYTAENEAIQARFGSDVHVGLPASLDDWNAGRGPRMLCLHPRSAGHGINLQHGGSQMVFFSLPWSREEYEQAIGRLHRRGQTRPVTVHRLMRPASVDGDVWRKLRTKGMKLAQLLDRIGHRNASTEEN